MLANKLFEIVEASNRRMVKPNTKMHSIQFKKAFLNEQSGIISGTKICNYKKEPLIPSEGKPMSFLKNAIYTSTKFKNKLKEMVEDSKMSINKGEAKNVKSYVSPKQFVKQNDVQKSTNLVKSPKRKNVKKRNLRKTELIEPAKKSNLL